MNIKWITKFLLIILLIPTAAIAYKSKGKIKINREFGGIHMVSVPQEIEISEPPSNAKISYGANTGDPNAYLRMMFANENGQLAEDFILKYMKVNLADEGNRLIAMKKQLVTVLNQIETATLVHTFDIEIGSYKGVVINAQNGPYYLVIAGILNPKSHHCVFATMNIDPRNSTAKTLEDLNEFKAAGHHILQSIVYKRELM